MNCTTDLPSLDSFNHFSCNQNPISPEEILKQMISVSSSNPSLFLSKPLWSVARYSLPC
ncbi:hypothetical protein ENUP19_0172G0036 [Entamoeba nuttalli]|uniref:Uncharacterized protein n=1 Tax=Entamoeba nuttalli TaxID=412467 RepID=A0ABQ0DMN9_9EUKA